MVDDEDGFVKVEPGEACKTEARPELLPFVNLSEQEPIPVPGDSSESDSDTSLEEPSSDVDVPPPRKVAKFSHGTKKPVTVARFYRHQKSGMVHYLDVVMDSCATKVFACGRAVTQSYVAVQDSVGMCKLCRAQALKRGV